MRILFSSLSAHGHTYPLFPLATAARAVGHEVSFASGPEMHSALAAAGFEPITAGIPIHHAAGEAARELFDVDDFRRAELTPEQRNSLGAAIFGTVLPRRYLDALQPVIKRVDPELIVFDVGNSGAELAAQQAGVPAMCHGLGRFIDEGFGEHRRRLEEFATERGLSASPSPFGAHATPYLDIYPDSLQKPEFRDSPRRVPLRPVPFAEPGPLPEEVSHRAPDRPLVYLTYGTGFGSAKSLRQGIDALATLDARVLAATGPSVDTTDLVPRAGAPLPGNVTVHQWVPQAELLPHVDLAVHHGGSGTTLGALSAGIPQLLLPLGADQFDNAEAIHTSGAGERLLPDEITSERLAAAARRLLEGPEFRDVASRIAAEIENMPPPEEIARRLPELAG